MFNWFKEKEEKSTEVCGFLNCKGEFFQDREKRGESDKEIKYKNEIKKLCSVFDSIIRSYPPYQYTDLSNFERIPDEAKARIILLAGEFLLINKKYKC